MKKVFAALLLLISLPSHAYFMDGNQLVDLMREWERANQQSPGTDYVKAGKYSNYVMGAFDALELNEIVCASESVTVGQVSAIVAKFLTGNPERWSDPASYLVSDSLKRAFPCRRK